MKIKLPNESKNQYSKNITLPQLLNIVNNEYSKLLKINNISTKNNTNLFFSLIEYMLSPKYLQRFAKFGNKKHTTKLIKQKVLSIYEMDLLKLLQETCDNRSDKENISDIQALININKYEFISEILESDFPQEMKIGTKKAIKKFTDARLKEYNISPEEFERYMQNPKNEKKSSTTIDEMPKEKSEENQNEVSKETPKENQNEVSKETPKENQNEVSKEMPKENQNEVSKEMPKQSQQKSSSNSSKTSKPKTFFEQVKGYTNNFSYLISEQDLNWNELHRSKFSDYESYLKYSIFQRELNNFMTQKKKTELETIKQILNKKIDKFNEIDEDFTKILLARKKIIEEKNKDIQH